MTTKIEVGYTFNTKSGEATVIAYTNATNIDIMFTKTGHVQKAIAAHIRSGKVRDRSLPTLKSLLDIEIKKRKGRRYYVVDLDGNTHIFVTQKEVQDHLGLGVCTVRKLLLIGDIKGKYVRSITFK